MNVGYIIISLISGVSIKCHSALKNALKSITHRITHELCSTTNHWLFRYGESLHSKSYEPISMLQFVIWQLKGVCIKATGFRKILDLERSWILDLPKRIWEIVIWYFCGFGLSRLHIYFYILFIYGGDKWEVPLNPHFWGIGYLDIYAP